MPAPCCTHPGTNAHTCSSWDCRWRALYRATTVPTPPSLSRAQRCCAPVDESSCQDRAAEPFCTLYQNGEMRFLQVHIPGEAERPHSQRSCPVRLVGTRFGNPLCAAESMLCGSILRGRARTSPQHGKEDKQLHPWGRVLRDGAPEW